MIAQDGIREALLLLPVLGVAAGADLFVTLVVLGAAPAAPWLRVLPGSLADLGTPWVLAPAALLWAAEQAAVARASPALAWHAAQDGVRPVAAALVGVLLLDGAPAWTAAVGGLAAAVLAAAAHGLVSGWSLLRHARRIRRPRRLLIALALSAGTVGLLVLAFEHPTVGAAVAAGLVVIPALAAPRLYRLAGLGVRFTWDALWSLAGPHGWSGPGRLPPWALDSDRDTVVAPTGLRGCRVALLGRRGRTTLTTGWLLVGHGPPRVRARGIREVREIRVDATERTRTVAEPFFVRVAPVHAAWGTGEEPSALLLASRNGPGPPALLGELARSHGEPKPDPRGG